MEEADLVQTEVIEEIKSRMEDLGLGRHNLGQVFAKFDQGNTGSITADQFR